MWLQNLVSKTPNLQVKASWTITALLLAVSAWLLGQMFWMLQGEQQAVPKWSPKAVATTMTTSNGVNISDLQKSELFGEYQADKKPVEVAPVVQDAPKTRLNLTLVGVVASSNASRGLAVIANRGSQATYGINEQIEGSRASLKAVLADRVIIDNAGRDETLMLDGIDYSKRAAPTETRPKPALSVGNNAHNQANQLEKIRQQITKDPQQIFQYVRMSQVKRDGDVVGYRVTPGKQPELFRSVGLQSGDIAVQINGQDLTDPKAMSNVFKSITELSELNLTVERDGQQHDIYIEF
ncbi:type II secretion system protein GspC [Vibrio paucivorans]|uniref:type II secretion system protein GspC n=1 Tax=Vibrio paucivorans TaxID=2829489 RepID=UPI0036F270A7